MADRRALRHKLGSRTARRAGTKRHSSRKYKGKELNRRPAARLKEMLRRLG
jgi:hypothetical protein